MPDVTLNIAYLCRGSGFGHAVRARLLLETLLGLGAEIDLQAQGLAVEYFSDHKVPHHDMQLPEGAETSPEAIPAIRRAMGRHHRLDLVVSDELLLAAPIARAMNVPCALLSCFTPGDRPGSRGMGLLFAAATQVIIPDWPFLHADGGSVADAYLFTGPLVKPLRPDVTCNTRTVVVALGAIRLGRASSARQVDQARTIDFALRAAGSNPGSVFKVLATTRQLKAIGVTAELPSNVLTLERLGTPDTELATGNHYICAVNSTLLSLVRGGVQPTIPKPSIDADVHRASYLSSRGLARVVEHDWAWLPNDVPTGRHIGHLESLGWADAGQVAEHIISLVPRVAK